MSSSQDHQGQEGLDAGDQDPALTNQLFPTQSASISDNLNSSTLATAPTATLASIHPPVAGWTDGFTAPQDALPQTSYGDQYASLWRNGQPSPQLQFMSAEDGGWGLVGGEDDGNDDVDGNVARKDFPDAFGTIVMPDAVFVITTRTVLIGRDVQAFKKYKSIHQYQQRVSAALEQGLPPPSPPKAIRRNAHGSFISEEGGILGPEDEAPNPAKRRKISASGDASDQRRITPDEQEQHERIISRREYLDHTPGAVPVDVSKLRPPENVIARLDIHGRGPDHFATTKGISREHLKIQYNPKRDLWEVHGLGRNGFFCEDKLYQKGQTVPLYSGAHLQIQNIQMEFRLTNVPDGKFRPEVAYSENGKSMSFDFVSSQHGQVDTSDSEDGSAKEGESRLGTNGRDFEDSDADMDDADAEEPTPDGDDMDGIRETVESDPASERQKLEGSPDDADQLSQVPFAPKKRGPGRPPKNGVMSKRQERELRKQAQEAAKKNLPPQEPGEQPQKRKVGRPRKHPESADGQGEKRKYKPRKPKGEDGEEELDGEKPAKERSQKHKTPPLELKREDFTEEQLQKPTKNYQLLIDEIMSAAPEKGYSLKQVYKRIQEKWPFFYFCVDTKGWESSVRHNLLGSECFKKIDGNWHRVAGVPLESGKKRKPSDSTADPRPTGMYNGYTHPYQHSPAGQPHGHQPITHSSGLGQPNLPPRYPPAGQAYQIHQGPNPNTGQASGPPNAQGPARPGFPLHQAQSPMPANTYAPAGAQPRPQYPGPQPPAYNPAYGNRTQPPRPVVPGPAGPHTGPNPAQRPPMAKPGSGPQPQHGMPIGHTTSASNMTRPSLPPQPQQPMQRTTTPAPLPPIIMPLLKTFIREFRSELLKQLNAKGEGKRSEAIAMSAINRGLGLTNRSLVPDKQIYEKPILEIFAKHKMTFPQRLAKEMAKTTPAAGTPTATKVPPAVARTPQPSQAALPQPPSSAVPPVATIPAKPDGQADKSIVGNGPMTNGSTQGSSATGAPKPVPDTTAPAAPAATQPASAGPAASTPAPAAALKTGSAVPDATTSPPTASASPSVGPVSKETVKLEHPATGPNSASAGVVPTPSATASSATAKPDVTGPTPAVTASPSDAAPKPIDPSQTGANARSSGPTATSVNPAQGPSAAHSAGQAIASSSAQAPSSTASPKPDVARPASSIPGTAASAITAPAPSRPASAAPSPIVPATTPNPPSRPVLGASATPVPSAVANVNVVAPRPPPSIGASSAKAPIPGGPRGTPTRTGHSATPESVRDIQLLEPKLVELILNFKSTILPTLAGKLNELLSESLIMSAVNRQLGFTDESFVETTTELQKKNFAEAENALMSHLETRFNQYRRERERDRTSQR
ncbi:hypothetical protein N0V93_000180 [Gnomoniopsis smithogilvyi]|uniref:Fork-head domain-containing protein n=1 Tax=Gnomoniopsis smithogilvyi TaxID=1191159 RepID=A0A9W8YZR1_9PEZI|nr:hypothetical protein N0V93_000180 [Gnomoniopsis smithogilvyi]